MATLGTTGLGVTTTIVGLRDTERALKKIDPELHRQFTVKIREIVEPIAARARSKVPSAPLSGWAAATARGQNKWGYRLGWNVGAVAQGIKVRKGGGLGSSSARRAGVRVGWRVTNMSPAGAVFELAGRRSRGSSPQGQAFIRNLERKHGKASRLIWSAWDEMRGEQRVVERVVAAVHETEMFVQRHLDAASDRS